LNPVYKNIISHKISPDGDNIFLACKKDGWKNVDIFSVAEPTKVSSIRFSTDFVNEI